MTFEMWSTASDGSEFKSLEVNYTKTEWPEGAPNPHSTRPAASSGAATSTTTQVRTPFNPATKSIEKTTSNNQPATSAPTTTGNKPE
jgi:hypothetical protein